MKQRFKDTDQDSRSLEEDELSLSSNSALENVNRQRGTWRATAGACGSLVETDISCSQK